MDLPSIHTWSGSPARGALVRSAVREFESATSGAMAVAYSGGADSTALLATLAQLSTAFTDPAPVGAVRARPLLALHVHHGLQPAADDFAAHATAFCGALGRELGVRLIVDRVHVSVPAGASVEAQARDARYAALAARAAKEGAGTVLLAQHADDQVESMLIALGRGAGVAGLAGMAREFERDGVRFVRPLLDLPAAPLRQWLLDNRIPFVDDPTNTDMQRTRNRLRTQVMPALEAALPRFRETFARSARLCAQARTLLDERADDDLRLIGEPVSIAALRTLRRERQANALRLWLRRQHATTPSEGQIEVLLDVVASCTTRKHDIDLRIGRGHVRRDGDRLRFDALPPSSDAPGAAADE